MCVTGEPGAPPAKTGNPVADINAGILAALGIVSRLRAQAEDRARADRRHVADGSRASSRRTGRRRSTSPPANRRARPAPRTSCSAPYQAFRAADGWINIGGANQANWERICRVLGASDWRDDARFRTNADRMKNLGALTEVDERAARRRRKVDELDRGASKPRACPCGPDQFDRRGARPTRRRSRATWWSSSTIRAPGARARSGCPMNFSRTPGKSSRAGAAARAAHARSVGGVRLLARRDRRAGTERSRSRWLISSPHNDRRST